MEGDCRGRRGGGEDGVSAVCPAGGWRGEGPTLREMLQQQPQKRALSLDLVTAAPTVGPVGAPFANVPASLQQGYLPVG